MKNRKGFTIIEVLVATFLLSIVIALPLSDIFIRTNFRIRRMQRALSFEKDLIERVKALPYNSTYLSDDGDKNDLDNLTQPDHFVDTISINTMRIARFYNVADDIPSAGMKTIKVFVLWRDIAIDTTTHVLSSITIKNTRW